MGMLSPTTCLFIGPTIRCIIRIIQANGLPPWARQEARNAFGALIPLQGLYLMVRAVWPGRRRKPGLAQKIII